VQNIPRVANIKLTCGVEFKFLDVKLPDPNSPVNGMYGRIEGEKWDEERDLMMVQGRRGSKKGGSERKEKKGEGGRRREKEGGRREGTG
jgi:hypothetical protein